MFCAILSLAMSEFSQDEANSDTYVPFAGDELRIIQEDGDIRAHSQLIYLDLSLTSETSEPSLPQNGR